MISFRERGPIPIGIASLIGITIGLLFAFYFKRIPFFANNYTVQGQFADAAGLGPENEVRVAGIKVGKVTRVELRRNLVVVSMEIQNGVEIPRRSTAEISLKTILGTKFVKINARGSKPYLKDGDTIPLRQTSIPFEIYQASNAGVELLQEIDAKALNEGFKALAELTRDPNRNVARTLEGTAEVAEAIGSQSDALESLIARGEELVAALDESSPDIQRLLTNSDTVLNLLARRRATVQSLLRNTDRLLGSFGDLLRDNRGRIDSILRDLHAVLLIVDSKLADLEQAIRLLGPSSESLARLTWRGRWAGICVAALEVVVDPNAPAIPVGVPDSVPC
jgi:phospholipid/cholesterol/gamma-HCH transport system substrate-binding protein